MWLAVKINEARVNAACRNPPRKHLHFYDHTVARSLAVARQVIAVDQKYLISTPGTQSSV